MSSGDIGTLAVKHSSLQEFTIRRFRVGICHQQGYRPTMEDEEVILHVFDAFTILMEGLSVRISLCPTRDNAVGLQCESAALYLTRCRCINEYTANNISQYSDRLKELSE